jgi:hypothetical protein
MSLLPPIQPLHASDFSGSVAFLQTSAMGDCLLATAVLAEVKRLLPRASITWLIFDEYRGVAANCPLADDYMAWPLDPDRTRREQEAQRWTEMIHYAQRRFDRLIVPQCYPFHNWTARPGVHLVDQMFAYAGCPVPAVKRLHFLPRRHGVGNAALALGIDAKVVTANTRGITQQPSWSGEQWTHLGRLLDGIGYRLVIGEDAALTLPQWHECIRRSALYVGLDSGGSWLAATIPHHQQLVIRSAAATCPEWLTSVTAANVKTSRFVHELTDPMPQDVLEAALPILGQHGHEAGGSS